MSYARVVWFWLGGLSIIPLSQDGFIGMRRGPPGMGLQLSNFLTSNEGSCVFQDRGKNQGNDGHELE